MKKIITCFVLAVILLLCGCHKSIKLQSNDLGLFDKESNIQYIVCARRAVKPLQVGAEYATDGENTYYKIPWEKAERFICDQIEGDSWVYRASTVEDITINNFNPISALVYLEGERSLYVSTFFCEEKYLPEEKKNEDNQDDSAIIYAIRDVLISGERVTVAINNISYEDEYFIRLMSVDYPGIYYTVVFFTDKNGEAYLRDRGTNDVVLAPDNVVLRMIG